MRSFSIISGSGSESFSSCPIQLDHTRTPEGFSREPMWFFCCGYKSRIQKLNQYMYKVPFPIIIA